MLQDVFVEKFIVKNKGIYPILFAMFSTVLTIFIVIVLNVVPILLGYNIIFFTGIISFGLCYLCYYINKMQKTEYEISLTNDMFTVTRILAQEKREVLCDFNLKDCLRIGPVTEEKFAEAKKDSEFTLNCTEDKEYLIDEKNWYFYVSDSGVKYLIIFEFDARMYKAFRRYNPRNTFFTVVKEENEEVNE